MWISGPFPTQIPGGLQAARVSLLLQPTYGPGCYQPSAFKSSVVRWRVLGLRTQCPHKQGNSAKFKYAYHHQYDDHEKQ